MGRRRKDRDRPVVGPSCADCRYVGYLCSQSASKEQPEFCGYLLATGRRRPCPAGPGCTVREAAGRRPRRTDNQTEGGPE